MSTLKDIAERAGVSISTVSYVLNGKKSVSGEVNRRILDAAEALRYVPNKSAVSLKTNISRTIGVLMPHFSSIFFVEMLQAIEDVAYEHGYSVIFSLSHEDNQREQRCLRNLLGEQIDGLLLVANDPANDPIPGPLSVPVVKLYRSMGERDCCCSSVSYDAGRMAGAYLAQKNSFPCAMIAYAPTLTTITDRVEGFFDACRERGLEVRKDLLLWRDGSSFQEGYLGALELLERRANGERIRAVYACNDVMALGVIRALHERGVRIPQDIAVMGHDNIQLAGMGFPALTTVDIRGEESARIGARMLIDLMAGRSVNERQVILRPKLVIRESA